MRQRTGLNEGDVAQQRRFCLRHPRSSLVVLSLEQYFSARWLQERVAAGSRRHCGEILLLYLASGNKELLFQEELLLEVSH